MYQYVSCVFNETKSNNDLRINQGNWKKGIKDLMFPADLTQG